ncbi:MAG: flavin reductase family protein [Candidatus Altiarchaeota archaeon]
MSDVSKTSRYFAQTVTIVTASSKGKENAMPATWCSPVSFNPTLILVNISPGRFTHDMIVSSGEFGLNLLAEDQMQISKTLGSLSGRDTDKFSAFKIETFAGERIKAQLIKGCVANMECKLEHNFTAGDHSILVGRVLKLHSIESKKPLILHGHKYYRIGDIIDVF